MSSINRTTPRLLFVTFEGSTWEYASHWSYTANLAFQEGFEANGIEYLTLIANPLYFEKKASWLDYARELCAGQQFDQAWIEIVHSRLDEQLLDWLTTVAPVRVGFACESLELSPEEWSNNPTGCQLRQDALDKYLKYITHIVAFDEADVDRFNQSGPVSALWWPLKVPKRYVCYQPPPFQHNVAIFYGALYGDRRKWLETRELAGLLVRPSASLEHFTRYPKIFDELQIHTHRVLESGKANRIALSSYLEQLRHIRQACFALWLETLQIGSSVVNLPQRGKGYAGRVIEGMAAGRPVIAWEIPDCPRTKALFEDGKEILLYSDPEQLSEHIRRIKSDPGFGREIAANARVKVESFHTTEKYVREVFEWASGCALTPRGVRTTWIGEQPNVDVSRDSSKEVPQSPTDALLHSGDLVFDVGAHVGNKTDVYLRRGAHVVCIEPQPDCARALRKKYQGNNNVVILEKGLADKPGKMWLSVCNAANTISTFSEKWKRGRFSEYKWDKRIKVDVITLDELIHLYGVPKYCKVDVEGFEYNVLKGLTQIIPYLSFEFTIEFIGDAQECVEHLVGLGYTQFNAAIGENNTLFFQDWVSPDTLFGHLRQIDDRLLWGDIYARADPEVNIRNKTDVSPKRGIKIGKVTMFMGRARLGIEISVLVIRSWLQTRHPVISQFANTSFTTLRSGKQGLRSATARLRGLLRQKQRLLQHFYRFWLCRVVADPGHILAILRQYERYVRDWRSYARMPGAEPIHLADSYPCLEDRTATTPFDAHYFYQDLWAFKLIQRSGTPTHLDVGSLVTFVGMLTAITKVTFIDIRPFTATLENFDSTAGSILALPFRDGSIPSLSCLHVAEHIGLGRYGDPLDPEGTKKAAHELARVLAPQGNLYFSVPVGKPRVCFNAHRIHSPQQILDYFYDLQLVQFSGIDDGGTFRQGIDPSDLADASYACGLFHFTKKP